MLKHHFDQIKPDLFEIKNVILTFIRHPLQEMKQLPDWHWRTVIVLHLVIAASCSFLEGIIRTSFFSMFYGVFIAPLIGLISVSVATFFFYYAFQFFLKQTCSLRRIFTVVVFANIPFFIFQIMTRLVPPAPLIGISFTAILLVIGFSASFHLNRRSVAKVVGGIYLIVVFVWLWGKFDAEKLDRSWDHGKSKAPEVELGD